MQTVPHAPQLFPSEVVFTQPAGHAVSPAWQVQAPAVHSAPTSQAVPHCPQFAGSVAVATHAVPQLA